MLRWTMDKSRVIRRTLTVAGLASAAALVLFHVALFAAQIADGRLFEPATALRWLGAALVLGIAVQHRRAGVDLLKSRKGLVLGLVVVLLHASAAAPVDTDTSLGVAEALLALPATA